MFSQSAYGVNENDEPAQAVLVLTNPASIDITLEVYNTDGSATGEYCSISIHNIMAMTNMLQEEGLIMILDRTQSHSLLWSQVFHLKFP